MANKLLIRTDLLIEGDGSSTSLIVDLKNDPVLSTDTPQINSFNLGSNPPSSVVIVSFTPSGVTVTPSLSGSQLTLSFSGTFTGLQTLSMQFLF